MNYKQLNFKVEELSDKHIHASPRWLSYTLYKMIRLFGIALYTCRKKELNVNDDDLRDIQLIRENDDKVIRYILNFLSSRVCRDKLFRVSARITMYEIFNQTNIEDYGRSSDVTLVTLAYGIRLSEELGNSLKYKK